MDHSKSLHAETVTHTLSTDLIDHLGGSLLTQVRLAYDPADPYAVGLLFDQSVSAVRWEFGRDLLATGLYEPSGEGDVQLWPCLDTGCRAVVMVELYGATGDVAQLQVRSRDVRRFLDATYASVPEGTEGALLHLGELVASLLREDDHEAGTGD